MEPKKDCKLCERVGAMFGLLVGLVFVFISIDLLTGGAISTLISGANNEEIEAGDE